MEGKGNRQSTGHSIRNKSRMVVMYGTYNRGGGWGGGEAAKHWTQYSIRNKGSSCSVLTKEGRLVFLLRGGGEAGSVRDKKRVAVVPYLPKRGGWSSFCGVMRGGREEGRRAQCWTKYQDKGGNCSLPTKEGRLVFFLRGGVRGRGGGEAGTVLDTVSGTRVAVVVYLPKRGGWSSFCGEEGRLAQ
jgi:hypothetical protein